MVTSCSAYNCTNRVTERGAKNRITFHRFPKDKVLLKKWIANMKRDEWTPTKASRLCTHHFSPDCYETSGWSSIPRLKSDAVPTIFLFPELQIAKKRCRAPNKKMQNAEKALEAILQSGNDEQNENRTEIGNTIPKRKRPRLYYLGDVKNHIAENPEAKSEHCAAYTDLVEKLLEKKDKQIKLLRQQTRRLNKRLTDLQSLVIDLVEKKLISEENAQSMIQ